MKKLICFLVSISILIGITTIAKAQSFSAVNNNSDIIYYNITGTINYTVSITYKSTNSYYQEH